MSTINILPPLLSNQIAAGEVVDRPSSVVKECVENALDSGADSIKITIKNFGKEAIIIEDNGSGIPKKELPKTILRHATSKVSSLEDLSNILTFGFRGEALASISSVSRFRISSYHKSESHGWSFKVDGDQQSHDALEPSQIKSGTRVEVRDLFFNTPARRRFLKSDRSEWFAIDDVVKRAVLSYPNIAFKLIKNDQKPRHYESCKNLTSRAKDVLGSDFSQSSIEINNSFENIKIEGVIGLPTFSRSQSDMQYLFLNQRPIKDKNISSAVKRAYQDVMYGQRFPAYVINFNIDPHEVDINVHPSKELVRFANHSAVCQAIYKTIKDSLANHRPAHQINHQPQPYDEPTKLGHLFQVLGLNEFRDVPHNSPSSNHFTSNNSTSKLINTQDDSSYTPIVPPHVTKTYDLNTQQQSKININSSQSNGSEYQPNTVFEKTNITTNYTQQSDIQSSNEYPLGFAIGQVHGVFILATNSSGLIVIDMHAAHERILYEKLKSNYSHDGISKQSTLIPIKLKLDEHQINCLNEFKVIIENLGFEFTLKDNELSINATPLLLGHLSSPDVFESILSDLMQPASGNEIQASS